MSDALERLEKWSHGHKSRSVTVESPDGYGAGCWSVSLGHENGVTRASEVTFFSFPEDKGGAAEYLRQAAEKGCVFVVEDENVDWPGLEKTILCALDAFDKGIWAKRD